jgi:hypothetical protein
MEPLRPKENKMQRRMDVIRCRRFGSIQIVLGMDEYKEEERDL